MSVLIPDEIPEILKKTNGYSLLIKGSPGMGKSTFALTLMVEKANHDKSLAFLETYLAKLMEYQRPKPHAEVKKKV